MHQKRKIDREFICTGLTPEKRRALILISKTLLRIANGETSGQESYMSVLNPFIDQHIPALDDFFRVLGVRRSSAVVTLFLGAPCVRCSVAAFLSKVVALGDVWSGLAGVFPAGGDTKDEQQRGGDDGGLRKAHRAHLRGLGSHRSNPASAPREGASPCSLPSRSCRADAALQSSDPLPYDPLKLASDYLQQVRSRQAQVSARKEKKLKFEPFDME
jgi:hypothetical protein